MNAILLSIRPEWAYEIANGYKLIEVRKSCPNLEVSFKVYIYCTGKYPRKNPRLNCAATWPQLTSILQDCVDNRCSMIWPTAKTSCSASWTF